MSVYNKSGQALPSVYGIEGSQLNYAYDISGNQVSGDPYAHYQITNIGGSVAAGNTQGIDIYGDTLAVWDGEDIVKLYSLDTLTSLGSISTGISMHGNDISFSDEFYDESDPLPLLYVCNPQTACFRITHNNGVWADTLINRITTPNIYGMKIAEAFNGDTLITIGYGEERYTYTATNKLIIATWDMTDLTDNGDGSYTPALIGTVTRDWLECLQGAAYHDGYLWVASGLGNTGNNGRVYALDISTGEIVVDIDLNDTHELEGLAWAYNNTDGWYILVGQVSIGFRKITFGAN